MKNFIGFQEWLLSESSESDQHEHAVAAAIDAYAKANNLSWKAERPKVGTNYSDVRVTLEDGTKSWIEVKMNVQDQLGTPRFFYKDQKWQSNMHTPIAQDICKQLQQSADAQKFIDTMAIWTKIEPKKLYLSPYKSEIKTAKSGNKDGIVTLAQFNSYAKKAGGRYIMKQSYKNIDKVLAKHYLTGKAEPAQYIQLGDNFYMLDKHNNPLGFVDVPVIEGDGILNVRFTTRSEFYEIQAEIKFDKSIPPSPVSFKPGSKKPTPTIG